MRFVSYRCGAFALGALLAPSFSISASVPAAAADRDPIVIGAILSITGLYAPLGEPESNALLLAEKDINAHGGIAGRPLHIVIQDDEGKPDVASQLATTFVGQNVACIIGGTLTATSIAIARVTNSAKVAQFYMTPTQTVWNSKAGVLPYVFETAPRNELEAAKLVDFAKSTLASKKFAVLHDDGAYGSNGSMILAAEAQHANVSIVDDEPFPITSTDLTAQLGKIKDSGADTLLIWTASPAAAIAVRQVHQLNLNVHVVGSTGIVSDNFLRVTGKDGDGVYADMDLNATHPNALQLAFLNAYHDAYHLRPPNFASFAWDSAHLAALALAKTKGNRDADAFAAALVALPPYHGTTATYKFSTADHNGMVPNDIHIAIDKNAVWFTL
jgi:branched-chain amino acid transport system substrate-binding protein